MPNSSNSWLANGEARWQRLADPLEGRRWRIIGALLLVIVFVLLLAASISRWSTTFDEGVHIYAGYAYWKQGDFGLNPEHPPLAKLVAALPLLPLELRQPELPEGLHFKVRSLLGSRAMLFGNDANALLFHARMAIAVFAVALICLVYFAARRMFGVGSAVLAAILIAFEPNILANGALVTTDTALACCFFGAVYAFYRYTEGPSISRLLLCGLAAGLTLSVKHSGLLIAPVYFLLAAVDFVQPAANSTSPAWRRLLRSVSALTAIAVLAGAVLWVCYSFRFSARPAGHSMTPTLEQSLAQLGPAAALPKAIADSGLVPEAYVFGLIDVMQASIGRPMFLLGDVHPNGRWFYFPTAFLIKSTLGFLFLFALMPFAGLIGDRAKRRALLFLALPAGVYLAISMISNLNIGYRHALPILPFAVVLTAASAERFARRGRLAAMAVAAAILLHAGSSVAAFPNYIAYSNEAWGGPLETHRFLTDSSVDWGQDVKRTGEYLAENGVRECWSALTITAFTDLGYYGVPCKPLPSFFDTVVPVPGEHSVTPVVMPGPVLIGSTELSGTYWGPGELNPYQMLQDREPTAIIGGSILVFNGPVESPRLAGESRATIVQDLLRDGRNEQAVQTARDAVELAPRSVRLRYLLALALDAAGLPAEADAERANGFSLADELNPDRSFFWQFFALMPLELPQ